MPSRIVVERLGGVPIERQAVEIVERKGLGHPDYMADSIAEEFSRNLSVYYIEHFGKILHHNVDKLEIIGGRTVPEFGGGKVIVPLTVLFSGRATDSLNGTSIPVKDIAVESARNWITRNLRFVDPDSLRYLFETKPGSANLTGAYMRQTVLSNDTSFGAGYAPLSHTEQVVMSLERMLNSSEFKNSHSYSGEDVKVMAVRNHKKLGITISNAMIDRYVSSIADYFDRKADLYDAVNEMLLDLLPEDYTFRLGINNMDSRQIGKDGCYLTVTGTSAEHGDDGAVGRGNRANGLITPNRVMSFEALAGKNPVSHIGKIYNILAFQIAENIFRNTGKEVAVKIAGRIGDPIEEPEMVSISVWPGPTENEHRELSVMALESISDISSITRKLISGAVDIF